MGTVINNDILKINLGLFLISTLLMTLVTKLKKQFAKNKKLALFYALFVLVSFALIGLLSSSKVLNDTPLNSFYGFEFLFFMLGILHLHILRKYFPDLSNNESQFLPEFLFTLVYVSLGLITFLQVTSRFKPAFSYIYMASALFFVIPFLFYKMYEFAMQIALPIYESWVFPLGKEIKEPTKEELLNPKVISFEFRKNENENDIINFRIKAPQGMEFGKLFYFFILDYNERHPESEIEILDEKTQHPCTWIFYFKPHWWSAIKHINFNKTIAANEIKEDSVIICSRVPKN
ncbi:TssN family type VI secretion system protein [uncultured Zobellia sp.]|uniref:TssN family type VI secretion system protein n=1 Tax=uncultured Zobellia sp. TaxID=255433 RepID=UPI002599993F|nr:TssN family type VI secretion system protein [uncultured Zobellia sp.]